MKKLFIILIAFSLFSCEEKDPIKEKVISEVKSRMKNPDSFEFVSYEIFRKQTFKEAKKGIEFTKELIKNPFTTEDEKVNYQKEIKFINSGTNENDIAIYSVYLTAKGTNSFGAIIQSKYVVKVLNNDIKDVVYINEKK